MTQTLIDITGEKFHRLTVIGFSHMQIRKTTARTGGRSMWFCRCDCGKEVVLRKDAFAYKSSRTKSCGCWHKERSSKVCIERNTTDNPTPRGDDHYMRKEKRRYPTCPKTGQFVKWK